MSAKLTKGFPLSEKGGEAEGFDGVLWVMHKTYGTVKVLVTAQALCQCVGYADSFSAKSTIPQSAKPTAPFAQGSLRITPTFEKNL